MTGYALLFRTAAGARTALMAMRRDDLKHSPPGGFLRWPEFGDDSLGAADTGKEPLAFYEWRVGNVVLVAQVDCGARNATSRTSYR